jgi:iron complex transport system permease protein
MHFPLKNTISFISLFMLAIVLFIANLWYGSVLLPWEQVWKVLTMQKLQDSYTGIIVIEYRLPQAITAMVTGMALGVAGLLLQTLFRNPLAGPSVLGISSGASLGVALVIMAGSLFETKFPWISGGDFQIVFAAMAGALVLLACILFISRKVGNIVTVLIIGIMLGYLVSAIVGVLQFFSRAEELHAYVLWGLGSFSKTSLSQSVFLFGISTLGVAASFFFIKPLNALLLGDLYAKSVGVNMKRLHISIILITGFLIAAATAFTGPIAFIGLAVPHLARNLFRSSNHGIILPAVILIGSTLALFCNLAAKLPGWDTTLPINAVTSLVGAPIVIWVIIKRGKFRQ